MTLESSAVMNLFENEWIHIGLLVLLVPVALISFYNSKKVHLQNKPFLFGGIGIALLVSAILFEAILDLHIEKLEVILTTVGSILLIIGHLYNIKFLKDTLPKECKE